jgi:hypothetical protein
MMKRTVDALAFLVLVLAFLLGCKDVAAPAAVDLTATCVGWECEAQAIAHGPQRWVLYHRSLFWDAGPDSTDRYTELGPSRIRGDTQWIHFDFTRAAKVVYRLEVSADGALGVLTWDFRQ